MAKQRMLNGGWSACQRLALVQGIRDANSTKLVNQVTRNPSSDDLTPSVSLCVYMPGEVHPSVFFHYCLDRPVAMLCTARPALLTLRPARLVASGRRSVVVRAEAGAKVNPDIKKDVDKVCGARPSAKCHHACVL
jgi:hypothetical protein